MRLAPRRLLSQVARFQRRLDVQTGVSRFHVGLPPPIPESPATNEPPMGRSCNVGRCVHGYAVFSSCPHCHRADRIRFWVLRRLLWLKANAPRDIRAYRAAFYTLLSV